MGVHTPQDVIAGMFAGMIVLYAVSVMMSRPERENTFMAFGIAAVIAGIAYVSIKSYPMDYDENGKLKNSENSSTMTIKANEGKLSEAGAGAGVGGGAPVSSSSESTDDDDDSELEELEQQQAQLRQKLNTESDEQVKAELRTELQTIENQIMQLKLK